ncbi:MAG TPA: M48 family metallopeptidase [Bacteroidia bacterium]|nr:M48 family metallopeptidase [Bacteroidia bacterium]
MNKGIYRDGVSPDVVNCEITLAEHKLFIYFTGQNRNMLIWDLKSLDSCGMYGATLKIVKDKVPGQALECSGEIAKTIFQAWSNPPAEIAKGRPKKVIAFMLTIVAAIITLGILCYVYLLPWAAGKAVGLISEDLEIKLGNNLSEVYLREPLNDSANFYANRFARNFDLQTKYPIHIYVIESEEINAFAVPGGNIFVYSGLIKKMNTYEELAALLGHEATHVIKRHSLKNILSSAASGMLISAFFGDMNGLSLWAVSKADEFKQLDYSRDLETEADQHGLKLMVHNKVSPKGMLDLLEVLKKESAEMPSMMKYLSTHPETEERIKLVLAQPLITKKFPGSERLANEFSKIKFSL